MSDSLQETDHESLPSCCLFACSKRLRVYPWFVYPFDTVVSYFTLIVSQSTHLVHVTRTLVEIRERRQVGDDRQHAGRVKLDMCRYTLLDLLFGTRHVHVYLLKRSHMVELAVLEVRHRPHHPRAGAEEVETRILASFGNWNVTNLEVQWDAFIAFGLEFTKKVGESFRFGRGGPTDDSSIELNDNGTFTVEVGSEDLSHTVRCEERGDFGDVKGVSDEFTSVGKMVQKTTRRSIGRVNGAQETCSVNDAHSSQLWYPPHESGSSFRTVVVFNSAKKAPRWIHRKCERYR